MVLSDRDIKKSLKNGRIKIKPTPDLKSQLGSCSIDLRLGNTFRLFNHSGLVCLDPFKPFSEKKISTEVKIKRNEPFIIHSGDFVLATTIETVELSDDILGRLEGRSSLGRMGIIVHSTATIFDPGFRGKVVMEMSNLGRIPVALYSGMRVCSFTFEELSSKADMPYWKKKRAKYFNQKGPEASRFYWEKK